MAKILREEVDSLNAILNITIEKADYINAFNSNIKKYQKESHLKGFRKGKVPTSYVRKVFGKQILAEEVNKTLYEQLNKALEGVDIFGEPLPNESQDPIVFNQFSLTDYEFKFDLGLIPEIEIEGVDENTSYSSTRVEASSEAIEKELENARKRFGERKEIEDNIEETDLVKVQAKELDENQKVKEGGLEPSFSIAVDQTTQELKEILLSQKKGNTITLNVNDVEKDSDEGTIRKYVLGIEDDSVEVGDMFECEITEVTRVELAEVNQDFFDKLLGKDTATSEEEAKDKLKETISKSYQNSADALLFRDIQKELVEKNNFDLPESFLKRWIKASNEDKNITDEQIEREFPFFCEGLRWSVLRGKLIQQFELTVSKEEIEESFATAIRNYMGAYMPIDDEMLKGYVERMFKDEKAVREKAEEIMGGKLFDAITEKVSLDEKIVNEKEMEEIIKAANQKMEEENEERKKAIEADEAIDA